MVDTSGYQDPRKASPRALKLGRGYFEARAAIKNLTSLELTLKNFSAEGVADKVLVVSMGDEISLSVPADPVAAQSAFVAWCNRNKVAVPGRYNVSWGVGGVADPKLFYYSNQFANSFGLDAMAAATALLRKYLPNANIGANYSPMTYGTGGYIQNVFMYPVNKAVTMFRSGAMTLPWVSPCCPFVLVQHYNSVGGTLDALSAPPCFSNYCDLALICCTWDCQRPKITHGSRHWAVSK